MATKKQQKPTVYTVIGLDGGKTSFGYSVIRCRMNQKRFEWKILESGVIPCPVNSMPDVKAQLPVFMQWIADKHAQYGITHRLAERFMTRGGSSMGTTIECISSMYGALAWEYKDIDLIPAAQWKNRVSKHLGGKEGLKAWYAEGKGGRAGYRGSPHELDATLQALYKGQLLCGIVPDYSWMDKQAISEGIEHVSTDEETRKRIAKSDNQRVPRKPAKRQRSKRVS